MKLRLSMSDREADWELLQRAADVTEQGAFAEYFELKRLLQSNNANDRREFETLFSTFFRLHSGGLTPEFKAKYFERLFEFVPGRDVDPYTQLLLELYGFPRRQGDRALQASFVSKLVAIHDESRPLFDRHVSNFFGLSVPCVGKIEFRISRFTAHLNDIQAHYQSWAADSRFGSVAQALFMKQPRLRGCHPSRICDFLVWTVGAEKLS